MSMANMKVKPVCPWIQGPTRVIMEFCLSGYPGKQWTV